MGDEVEIKNILEIGTFDGKTATILARLFPDSDIKTIDLSDNDPIFINTYARKNNPKEFIKKRNTLLSRFKSINFLLGPLVARALVLLRPQFEIISRPLGKVLDRFRSAFNLHELHDEDQRGFGRNLGRLAVLAIG